MIKQKGSILIIAVIISAAMLLMLFPFLFNLSGENRAATRAFKGTSAIALAEGGAERAIWEINYGDISTWEGTEEARTITLDIEGNIVDVTTGFPSSKIVTIVSTGYVSYLGGKEVSKTVRVILGRKKVTPFNFAVFADEGMKIDIGAIVDSFDSGNGAYGGENINSDGDIGTNSTEFGVIDILSSEVHGDVFCGVDGEAPDVVNNQGTITGELGAIEESFEFEFVTIPSDLPNSGNYMGEEITESSQYVDFRLGDGDCVTINGNIELVITGDFYMESGSRIDIASDASLKIYVDGTFDMDTGSQINTTSESAKDLFIITTENFTGVLNLDQNTEFWGSIYAPNADVNLDNDVGFYGSIVGKNVNIDQGTKIHYDESLKYLGFDSPYTLYVVRSWQEVY